jgi:hypothetical protein
MFRHELAEALLDAVDQVAQELDRRRDDGADHAGRLGQHIEQHVLELANGVDHTHHGVFGLVDEACPGVSPSRHYPEQQSAG